MKHTLKITLLLVLFFLVAQIVGLSVVNNYIDHKTTAETGNITYVELPYTLERPPVEETGSVWYIVSAILIGTTILLILIRFKKRTLWKTWFLFAVILTLSISFSAFIHSGAAFFLALIIGSWKVFKPNVFVHNFSEIFVYGGLAAIFVPIMNLKAGLILLVLISIYDMIAVWKSKHMIKLAKFQAKSKVFAGLLLPYRRVKKGKGKKVNVKTAILGGGDIGFPLIFAGIVMKGLMLEHSTGIGFLKSLIIPVFVSIALLTLLLKAEKEKFYPAMPFLSIGCLIGLGIVLLV